MNMAIQGWARAARRSTAVLVVMLAGCSDPADEARQSPKETASIRKSVVRSRPVQPEPSSAASAEQDPAPRVKRPARLPAVARRQQREELEQQITVPVEPEMQLDQPPRAVPPPPRSAPVLPQNRSTAPTAPVQPERAPPPVQSPTAPAAPPPATRAEPAVPPPTERMAGPSVGPDGKEIASIVRGNGKDGSGPVVAKTEQGLAQIVQRAREMVRRGQVLKAREQLLAAVGQSPSETLLELGRTFDPHYLSGLTNADGKAEPLRALSLYEEAAKLGSTAAARDLDRLRKGQPSAN